MKFETLQQNESGNIQIEDLNRIEISIVQGAECVILEKSKLPDFIKILQSFVES